jgi:competence protein ComEC
MDSDHIGGATELLNKFRVKQTMLIPTIKDTDVFWQLRTALLEEVAQENMELVVPQAGERLEWGQEGADSGFSLTVLAPLELSWLEKIASDRTTESTLSDAMLALQTEVEEQNDLSIALLLRYKHVSVALMGDASQQTELALVEKQVIHPVTALKVGHHGSNTSSAQSFLEATRPEKILLSVGLSNRYGHPSPQVLERLNSLPGDLWRTDLDGEVHLQTDGRWYQVTSSGK